MKISEFKKILENLGVDVRKGTKHWKLYYNGKQSTLPRHPGKELNEITRLAILKQLNIK
jgi:mRNA interferase HicA